MTTPTRDERIRGSMLASAVGDALGAEVEFLTTNEIRWQHGDGGVEGYVGEVGHITDDTQMLLFTAEGLIRGVNRVLERSSWGARERPMTVDVAPLDLSPEIIHHAYLRWLRTQGLAPRSGWADQPDWLLTGWLVERTELHHQRAPGNTCLGALRSGVRGAIDAPINDSKGCGGVMRVAPIGLVCGEDAFRQAAEATAITHGHPTGWLAAGALARVIERIVAGVALPAAIDVALGELAGWDDHAETSAAVRAAVALAEAEPSPTPEVVERLGGGWIAEEALAISLYCALTADDLPSALLASVNHSGDSDSTGAITGAILGAVEGPETIPDEWLTALAEREVVEIVAADLAAHVPSGSGTVAFDLERYPPN